MAAFLAGCSRESATPVAPPQVGTHSYYFELPADQKEKLRTNVMNVKIGDFARDVRERLGEPTYDQVLARLDGTFVTRVLSYYSAKWDKDTVNELHDRSVRFEFDSHNRLQRIRSNVDGIEDRDANSADQSRISK